MKIYVGNLDFKVAEEELNTLCAQYGAIDSVNIIKDRSTGESKGFGFVTFSETDSGDKAISDLDGKDFQGRPLRVSEARDKPRGGGRPGGNRGGGGGGRRFNNNRGGGGGGNRY